MSSRRTIDGSSDQWDAGDPFEGVPAFDVVDGELMPRAAGEQPAAD